MTNEIAMLIGVLITTAMGLFITCLVGATRRQELQLEIKNLQRRLETYMLGAK